MKKITLSLALLLGFTSAWADHWTPASAYDYPSENPVYASLKINGGVATVDSVVEIAAFIGDECRAIAKTPAVNGRYSLRVRGGETDNGKVITFKAYYKGLEYGLQPVSPTTFTEETAFADFELSAITGITTVNPLCVTADLPREETLVYEYVYQNAQGQNTTPSSRCTVLSPLSFKWDDYNSQYFSISGSVLNITGECAEMPIKCTVTGPIYGATQFKKSCSTKLTASYPVSFNYPSSLELNRFQTTSITLPNLIGSIFDPSLVEFQFPTIGGVPMAVVSHEKKNGTYYFHIYANMVGQGNYTVLYDGVAMKSTENATTASATVNASVSLPSGWSWLSLFATDARTNNINLMSSATEYNEWTKNRIDEIRSQFYLLYNDPQYGLFGDITDLNVADGMYKVKSFAKTSLILGYKTSNGFTSTKTLYKGYNWFNNPYQLDITLGQLSSAIGMTPVAGDKIIGKNTFAEYDGAKWQASTTFLLEAGKGYMYYSNSPGAVTMQFDPDFTYTVNSFVNTLVNMPMSFTDVRSRMPEVVESSHWSYDDSKFAENMVIVAELEGVNNPEDYIVGAFVGDECRGEGTASESGKMFVSVAGKSGENVSFKLYNRQTQEVVDINESIKYAKMAGSLDEPMSLSTDILTTGVAGVDGVCPTQIMEIHDMAGRKVSSMTSGTYLVTYSVNGNVFTKKISK